MKLSCVIPATLPGPQHSHFRAEAIRQWKLLHDWQDSNSQAFTPHSKMLTCMSQQPAVWPFWTNFHLCTCMYVHTHPHMSASLLLLTHLRIFHVRKKVAQACIFPVKTVYCTALWFLLIIYFVPWHLFISLLFSSSLHGGACGHWEREEFWSDAGTQNTGLALPLCHWNTHHHAEMISTPQQNDKQQHVGMCMEIHSICRHAVNEQVIKWANVCVCVCVCVCVRLCAYVWARVSTHMCFCRNRHG